MIMRKKKKIQKSSRKISNLPECGTVGGEKDSYIDTAAYPSSCGANRK